MFTFGKRALRKAEKPFCRARPSRITGLFEARDFFSGNPALLLGEGHAAAIFTHINMDSDVQNRHLYHAKQITISWVDPSSLHPLTGPANKEDYPRCICRALNLYL